MKRIIRLDSYLQRSSMSTCATLTGEVDTEESHHNQLRLQQHQINYHHDNDVVRSKQDYMKSFESLF